MIKFVKTHLSNNFKSRPFYQKPYFYFMLGVVVFSLAGVLHCYDVPYKDWISRNVFLRQSNIVNLIFDTIRPFGKYSLIVFFALLIGGVGRKKTCYKIFTSFVIMSVIVWTLKVGVHRERPNKENHHSFPSGDTGTATVLLVSVASDIPVLAPIAIAMVPSIAFLRTYDNYHHLSDVLAGIGIGIISVGLAMFITFRHNTLARQMKSRHMALLAVLMAIALTVNKIPESNTTTFTTLFMPSLLLWLLAPYTKIFAAPNKTKRKLFLTFQKIFRCFVVENITLLPLRSLDYGLAVVSVVILFIAWIHCDNNLKISISGLALIPINYLVIKEKMIANGKFKTASVLPFLSLVILTTSALITTVPKMQI